VAEDQKKTEPIKPSPWQHAPGQWRDPLAGFHVPDDWRPSPETTAANARRHAPRSARYDGRVSSSAYLRRVK
jgi:hypothetical protein